jgi:zinc transporter ZupT
MAQRQQRTKAGTTDHWLFPHSRATDHTASWYRQKIVQILGSHKVQIIFGVLLMIDLAVVVAEMMISEYSSCEAHVVCNPTGSGAHHTSGSGDHETSSHGLLPGCVIQTEKHLSHSLHRVEQILRYTSITILISFAAELLLMAIGLGHKFFREPLLVLDAAVVGVSIFFDIALHNISEEFVVLLIIVRLWRFARIFHALGSTVHEADENNFEDEKKKLKGRIHDLEESEGGPRGNTELHELVIQTP